MKKAVSENDYKTIQTLVHTLKGTGGGYGFDALTKYGFELEEAANEEAKSQILNLIAELEEYLEKAEIIYK